MNIDFTAPYDVLAKEIHQFNVDKGWWDEYLDDKSKRYSTTYMLVVSELAEAMEGCRKDLMDDKLPHHKMFDVELADAMIRLLDIGGAMELGLAMPEPMFDLMVSERTKPENLWWIITEMAHTLVMRGDKALVQIGIYATTQVAHNYEIDIRAIMKEKMEFNAIRADHLKENRSKPGGKAF